MECLIVTIGIIFYSIDVLYLNFRMRSCAQYDNFDTVIVTKYISQERLHIQTILRTLLKRL